LNVDGPLIAVVWPDEAGKTSLLDAMAHISREEPFARTEFTDRRTLDCKRCVVPADYAVEPEDCKTAGVRFDPRVDYILPSGNVRAVRWRSHRSREDPARHERARSSWATSRRFDRER
jgi:hypothetical protein